MSNDKYRDDSVSAAYRDLASERTPEHLDRKVLAMAAKNTKGPSYSRWISWARPLAWAATVTLCLAITLELVREPAMQPTIAPGMQNDAIPGLPDIQQDETAKQDAALAPERQQNLLELPGDGDRDEAKMRLNEVAETRLDDHAELAKDKATARQARDQNRSLARPEPQQEVAGSTANVNAAEKEELARIHSSVQASPAAPAEESAGNREKALAGESFADTPACSEERRATAESWLECILELQAAGRDAAAERERNALKDTFPDFNRP